MQGPGQAEEGWAGGGWGRPPPVLPAPGGRRKGHHAGIWRIGSGQEGGR